MLYYTLHRITATVQVAKLLAHQRAASVRLCRAGECVNTVIVHGCKL